MSRFQQSKQDFSEPSGPRYYLIAVYAVIATIVTVGYGDVVPSNSGEKVFMCVLLVFGVLIYTNVIGFFSSMMADKR